MYTATEDYNKLPEQIKAFFDRQYQDSYELLEASRHSKTGLYADAFLCFGQNPDFRSSIAATGVGLIGLAIADLEGWDGQAADKVIQTLRTVMGKTEGCKVARDPANGFFAHFIHMDSGENLHNSEFSTIDTSILIAGALLAGEHFKSTHTQIAEMAKELLHSVDWRLVVADKDQGSINMVVKDHAGSKATRAFNEYVIVAYLAKLGMPEDEEIRELWNNTYSEERMEHLPQSVYRDIPVFSDNPRDGIFLSSFVHQFPFYLVPEYAKSETYRTYFANACMADRLKWKELSDVPSYVWGYGAGSNAGLHGGYHADAIERSPGNVASAYIVAGFLPVYPAGIHDLYALYRLHFPYDAYHNPEDSEDEAKFCASYKYGLHRYSWWHLEQPDRRYPEKVTLIDWSSMLYGLAAFKRGMEFFADRHYMSSARKMT